MYKLACYSSSGKTQRLRLNLPCFQEYTFYRKLSLSDGYIIALFSCLVFLVPGTSQYLTLSPSPIRLKLAINRIMNLRGISGQDPVQFLWILRKLLSHIPNCNCRSWSRPQFSAFLLLAAPSFSLRALHPGVHFVPPTIMIKTKSEGRE